MNDPTRQLASLWIVVQYKAIDEGMGGNALRKTCYMWVLN